MLKCEIWFLGKKTWKSDKNYEQAVIDHEHPLKNEDKNGTAISDTGLEILNREGTMAKMRKKWTHRQKQKDTQTNRQQQT